jgi:hypothetical protein
MTTITSAPDLDTEELAGRTFSTEHFGPFTVRSASQAPELSAIGYMAVGDDGYLFIAFLPYGKELVEEDAS